MSEDFFKSKSMIDEFEKLDDLAFEVMKRMEITKDLWSTIENAR